MKKYPSTALSSRITALRKYYLENSPMATDSKIPPWKYQRSALLFYEGFEIHRNAPTLKLRNSYAEAYLLENTKPIIIEGELLVGQPDLSPLSEDEERRAARIKEYNRFIPQKRGRADHLAMDYTLLLDRGVLGVIEILDEKLADIDLDDGTQAEKYEYYLSCKIELEGFVKYAENYKNEARRLADESEGEKKQEYLELFEVLSQVPLYPARTFREALQSINLFTRSCYGIYSFGKPDLTLYKYYKNDIESGTLTEDGAQELIDAFFLTSVPNMSSWAAEGFMLGGRDEDGQLVENELTWHFLNAIAHTHIPDPNVGFCITEETGEEFVKLAATLIKAGHGQPQIWNSDAVTRSLKSYGLEDKLAYMFTLSTCVEVTPIGHSGVSITSPYINCLKIFLDSFKYATDENSFEEIFDNFKREFEKYAKSAILQENLWQIERARNCQDPARISVFINDCLEKGKNHECGGARCNFLEPDLLGVQNVTECLNVIKKLVFNEGVTTVSEMKKAIAANYVGFEALRARIVNKVAHFGTDDGEANEIQRAVTDFVLSVFEKKKTPRGAEVILGAFSYRDHVFHGSETAATPDGRLAGAPLNDGSSPVQGYDNKGVTASLASTVSWSPSRFLGGTSVNVKLNKSVSVENIIALIKSYIKTDGAQLQFNIVSKEDLLDAKIHPESHGDLLVRIGGYSDFFTKIPEDLQNDVISRTINDM